MHKVSDICQNHVNLDKNEQCMGCTNCINQHSKGKLDREKAKVMLQCGKEKATEKRYKSESSSYDIVTTYYRHTELPLQYSAAVNKVTELKKEEIRSQL